MRYMNYVALTVGLGTLASTVVGAGGQPTHSATDGQSVTLQGLVIPSKRIELGMRVPGILTSRPIMEGQYVETGQLIAELDSERERALIAIGERGANTDIGIRAAKVEQTFRKYELDRQLALSNEAATSEWEIRAAEISHRLATVQTEQAYFDQAILQAQLVRDRVLLGERKLTAPFSGWISHTLKDAGEPVDEFEPIAVLVQLDPLCVELNVSFEHFGRVSSDATATIVMDSERRQARITAVDPVVDPGSSTFRVRVEVENPDRQLVAGTMARVELHLTHDATIRAHSQTTGIVPPPSLEASPPLSPQSQDRRKSAALVAFPDRRTSDGDRAPLKARSEKKPLRLKPGFENFDWVKEPSNDTPKPP